MLADIAIIRAFLANVSRRLAWISAAQGAAAGMAIALILTLAGWPGRGAIATAVAAGLGLAIVGIGARFAASASDRKRVAYAVERQALHCKNSVITADELIERGSAAGAAGATPLTEYVGEIVCRDAAQKVSALDARVLFPARKSVVALMVTLLLWIAAVIRPPVPFAAGLPRGAAAIAITSIDVTVTPPAYAAQPIQRLRDPARIQALVGSKVSLTVHANAGAVIFETLRGKDSLHTTGDGTFTGDIAADADGYIAFEPTRMEGSSAKIGVRRLIGLSVTPDAAPHVRITAPAKDLFLHDANHTIELAIEADDDIGLAALRLRYTRVSGSGERYTFTEGELPLQITRTDSHKWTARASWPLKKLALDAGDMVVYRAAAADNRPGAAPTESDSYIAEVLPPGSEAAPGFEMDPDQERYAVSQQMIILKSERLLAKKAATAPDAYLSEANDIGGEQRKVRAEFVFMMGGEVEDAPLPDQSMTDLDETAESEGEADLMAGRMANQGRIALLKAIRSMSRANTALTTADLPEALTNEKAALKLLMTAFSHTRLILRALTEHERLDLSRRMTGALLDVSHEGHPVVDAEPDPRTTALRRVLSGIAALSASPTLGPTAAAQASALAEELLHIDASSKPLQQTASLLTDAAQNLSRSRGDDARTKLDSAATGLAAAMRNTLLNAPRGAATVESSALSGAFVDAMRAAQHPPR